MTFDPDGGHWAEPHQVGVAVAPGGKVFPFLNASFSIFYEPKWWWFSC